MEDTVEKKEVRAGALRSFAYERIASIDFIRGVAILGILIMNIFAMAVPTVAYTVPTWSENTTLSDNVVFILQSLLIDSRFISMLAILFAVGLAMQASRFNNAGGSVESAGQEKLGRAAKQFLRSRLLWLAVFGLIHGTLVWFGDILLQYAIAGLILIGVLHWKNSRLIAVAVVLFFVGQLLPTLGAILALITGENVSAQPALPLSPVSVDSFRSEWTGFPSRLIANVSTWAGLKIFALLSSLWHILGLMMLGIVLHRKGFFVPIRSSSSANVDANAEARARKRRTVSAVLCLSLSLLLGSTVLLLRFSLGIDSSASDFLSSSMQIPAIFGGIAYILAMVQLAQKDTDIVRVLKNTGKTAFTLYILQSVVSLFVFTVLFPQLWGVLGRLELLLYVLVFSVFQAIFADFWQKRYGQGPLEHLWRRLCYRKLSEEGSTAK